MEHSFSSLVPGRRDEIRERHALRGYSKQRRLAENFSL
jgi:hypothetical protein